MPREPIRYQRETETRSPSIFNIAVEGEKTEVQYFEQFNEKIHDSRLQIRIIRRDNPSHSAPKHILASISDYQKLNSIAPYDKLWIVIDRDRWDVSQLNSVVSQATSQNIRVAFSNPCFEIWLLFHFEVIPNHQALNDLNGKRNVKDKLLTRLRELLGSFNPSDLKLDSFYTKTSTAIIHAGLVTEVSRFWRD